MSAAEHPVATGTVPFLDVGATYGELQGEIDAAIQGVLERGWYVLGDEVDRFEQEFAEYTRAAHCVGVGSGLDALTLGLRALGVGPGDDVLVAAHTFIATWLAVTACGARPVPVEPDPRTHNLDPGQLAAALTPRAKGIVPVHLYGQPADLAEINRFAEEHGLWVLDDAAQAHGARYHGAPVGALTALTAWSFYPGKNLGAFGDAGAVTTNSPELADRVRSLRNYGSAEKYVHPEAGWNSRLDEIQAAVLRVKLRHLDRWNRRRTEIADRYLAALRGTGLSLPLVAADVEPVWHLFVVRHARRDALREELARRGVETHVHYPVPPHLQGAYSALGLPAGSLPTTERLHREVLSLPIGPHLGDDDVARVVEAVRASAVLSTTRPRAGTPTLQDG